MTKGDVVRAPWIRPAGQRRGQVVPGAQCVQHRRAARHEHRIARRKQVALAPKAQLPRPPTASVPAAGRRGGRQGLSWGCLQ